MKGQKMSKNTLFVLALFLLMPTLWAQSRRASANAEPRYDRLFSWNGDEYTRRFEVVIEKEDDGVFSAAERRSTNATSLKIALPQGSYRFCVIPYDLLDRPGKRSEWITFEVNPAAIAELPITEEPIKEIPKTIEPEKPIEEEEEKTESSLYTFIKAFDGYLSLSWMPLVPVHAFDGNQFFNQSPSLAGAGARFGVVYDELAFINPGLEFSVSWYAFDDNPAFIDNSSLHHVITMELDFITQKWLPARNAAFTFRLGVGITHVYFQEGEMTREGVNRDSFYADIGLSFLFLPKKTFYIETGVDYVFLFSQLFPGYFRPSLGIGWRL
jgi:hypothetical protein